MIHDELFETLSGFAPISLEQLNSTVEFLDRIDVKYLVHISELPSIIAEMKERFYLLTIKDRSIFSYDNVYMDTKDLMFYNQHEAGSADRTKVRTRLYTDSDLAFVEYKQKVGKTIRKFRYQSEPKDHGKMTMESARYVEGIYHSLYNESLKQLLFPALHNNYQRCTLCSKNNDERVTIDFNIEFSNSRATDEEGKKMHSLDNLVIIESKSTNTSCFSHEVMAKHGCKPATGCSKYCLGLYYLGQVDSWNSFQESIDTIEAIKKTDSQINAQQLFLSSRAAQSLSNAATSASVPENQLTK